MYFIHQYYPRLDNKYLTAANTHNIRRKGKGKKEEEICRKAEQKV